MRGRVVDSSAAHLKQRQPPVSPGGIFLLEVLDIRNALLQPFQPLCKIALKLHRIIKKSRDIPDSSDATT
jgi:hypothetical protein